MSAERQAADASPAGGGANPAGRGLGMIDRAAAGLHPAYFAMVMATGIVSLAARAQGREGVARGLFWVSALFFAVLWSLMAVRLARRPRLVLADLNDHARSVGFFTAPAAVCVLGSQTLLVQGAAGVAWTLWIAGAVLWTVLTYTIFTSLTVKAVKPTVAEGLNGGWLVSVVATQSVSVLAAQLAVEGRGGGGLLFAALVMWLGGAMLYVWIISLIFYRYTFFPFRPSDLTPPYWINMGAMAISTLAGATLASAGRGEQASPLLTDLLPFIKGATLLFWATASWWIPMLVILGVWRHVIKRYPLRYDPLYWGAVFPLGMYSVATARMAVALDLPFLGPLSSVFCVVAGVAWILTLLGLLLHLVRREQPGS